MLFLKTVIETSKNYTCGSVDFEFSGMLPYVVSTIIFIIKIIIPILLIIFGMIDFMKAVMAQKEDEIKKGQQTFIKRLIAAVIVFFIIQIVQLIITFVSGDDDDSIVNCFDCFVNGDGCTKVPKTNNTSGV